MVVLATIQHTVTFWSHRVLTPSQDSQIVKMGETGFSSSPDSSESKTHPANFERPKPSGSSLPILPLPVLPLPVLPLPVLPLPVLPLSILSLSILSLLIWRTAFIRRIEIVVKHRPIS